MPSKSIFKQPGARHFQLVHRSQRDPLIHDPEASTHVLKPVVKGKSRAELEQSLSPSDIAHDLERVNIGEASLFGIYYDDTEYDYLQHLREVGVQEDGVESVLIEAAPSSSSLKHPPPGRNDATGRRGKGKGRRDAIDLRDLPSDALPSQMELTRDQVYSAQDALPVELKGLQPDMNPHLRQTLEALDDDAFVDDSLEEDYFSELVGEGELDGDADDLTFESAEGGVVDEGEETEKEDSSTAAAGEEEYEGWEARFARFKKSHEVKMKEQLAESDLASDIRSEGGDTVGQLPKISVIGGKKRRKGASDASGYSMSSSSMFRNEGLSLLDERFDQVEKEYESSDEDGDPSDDSDEAPELITSREDFNAIMDDFLDNYEILGGKMRPVLPGETVTDKLGTIRQSLKEIGYDAHAQLEDDEDENDDVFQDTVAEKGERWDCETILSTYSNLENHPKLIQARDTTKVAKINLNRKTGVPSLKSNEDKEPPQSDLDPTRLIRVTVSRKKDESKEEKCARKQAVKEGRQVRRAEKKVTQGQFASERRKQLNMRSDTKKGIRKL